MAVDEGSLPRVVAEAKRTHGRSVVEGFLSWVVPPSRIELDTSTTRPRSSGGVPPNEDSDQAALQETVEWFALKGIDLHIEREGDGWVAVMIPQNTRLGSADYGIGGTPEEAAQNARSMFSAAHPD
jgi:hypothetical protein